MPGANITRALAGLLLGMALGAHGCRSSAFQCETDEQCRDGSTDGVCVGQMWCSFPDDECSSGLRYGESAGDDLAGVCVAEDPGTTTGPSSTGDVTSPSDPSSSDSVDPSVGATSSTTVPIGSTTDESTTTEVGSTTGDTAGSTGGVVCQSLSDDFEDGVIDPMWMVQDMLLPVNETAGALQVGVLGMSEASGGVATIQGVTGTSGFVNTSVVALPDDPDAAAWLVAVEFQSGYTVGVRVEPGEVTAHVGTQEMLTQEADVNIDEKLTELWLQILLDGEGRALLQYSLDGVAYETVFEVDVPPAQGHFGFLLVGERTGSIVLPGPIRFESFAASICD